MLSKPRHKFFRIIWWSHELQLFNWQIHESATEVESDYPSFLFANNASLELFLTANKTNVKMCPEQIWSLNKDFHPTWKHLRMSVFAFLGHFLEEARYFAVKRSCFEHWCQDIDCLSKRCHLIGHNNHPSFKYQQILHQIQTNPSSHTNKFYLQIPYKSFWLNFLKI